MLDKFIAEFIGTFFFISIIFNITNTSNPTNRPFVWLQLGFALSACCLLVHPISKCHLNPAVSIASWLHSNLTNNELAAYIIAQIMAAFLAYYFFLQIKNKL